MSYADCGDSLDGDSVGVDVDLVLRIDCWWGSVAEEVASQIGRGAGIKAVLVILMLSGPSLDV